MDPAVFDKRRLQNLSVWRYEILTAIRLQKYS